jgi:hypothetical protein
MTFASLNSDRAATIQMPGSYNIAIWLKHEYWRPHSGRQRGLELGRVGYLVGN